MVNKLCKQKWKICYINDLSWHEITWIDMLWHEWHVVPWEKLIYFDPSIEIYNKTFLPIRQHVTFFEIWCHRCKELTCCLLTKVDLRWTLYRNLQKKNCTLEHMWFWTCPRGFDPGSRKSLLMETLTWVNCVKSLKRISRKISKLKSARTTRQTDRRTNKSYNYDKSNLSP